MPPCGAACEESKNPSNKIATKHIDLGRKKNQSQVDLFRGNISIYPTVSRLLRVHIVQVAKFKFMLAQFLRPPSPAYSFVDIILNAQKITIKWSYLGFQ